MDRIDDPTAVPDKWGPGKNGFTDGDPLAGISVTYLNAQWFDGVQEELVAGLVEYLGLAPSAADNTQIRKALSRWFGGAIRTVTTTTTLTADDAGHLLLDASGGARTATLPLVNSANGRPIRLVLSRIDASANIQNLLPQGADTLNGLTGNCALPAGATVMLLGDGVSAWRLVAASGLYLAQSITATGNATVPWWSRSCRVECIGGGGGGGYHGTWATGGGGSGGRSIKRIGGLVPGATIACTIGAGGTGPAAGNPVNGNNGGTTSFGAHCSATGGGGGSGTIAGVNPGGGPGSASGGDMNIMGEFGGDAIPAGQAGGYGGGPGGGRGTTGFATGIAAQGYGGGGGGGGSSVPNGGGGGASGGNGQAGVIFVEWFP